MCLAIPGRVEDIDAAGEPRMGVVSFGGVKKRVCLELLPDAAPGDYVVVHVGFAISRVDEAEALETLKMIEQMGGLGELDDSEEN